MICLISQIQYWFFGNIYHNFIYPLRPPSVCSVFDRSRKKMSGKVRQRTSANAADSATQTVNEKILKECHSLYTDPENGENLFLFSSWIRHFLLFMQLNIQEKGQWPTGIEQWKTSWKNHLYSIVYLSLVFLLLQERKESEFTTSWLHQLKADRVELNITSNPQSADYGDFFSSVHSKVMH